MVGEQRSEALATECGALQRTALGVDRIYAKLSSGQDHRLNFELRSVGRLCLVGPPKRCTKNMLR